MGKMISFKRPDGQSVNGIIGRNVGSLATSTQQGEHCQRGRNDCKDCCSHRFDLSGTTARATGHC